LSPNLVKLLACLLITFASLLVLHMISRRAREVVQLQWLIAATWSARLALTIVVYAFVPHLIKGSDATNYYLPETTSLLSGQLPYLDFSTCYSPLFHLLLAPFVLVWPAVGSIVVVMLLAESLLLISYLKIGKHLDQELIFLRSAWLMVSSPVMVIWIGLMGYNGILIAAFTMLALYFQVRKQPTKAGLSAAMGLSACKLLGALTWPAVVLAGMARARTALPMLVMVLFMAIALVLGFDVLEPVKHEGLLWNGENIWVMTAALFPAMYRSPIVTVASPLLFGALVLVGTRLFLRNRATTEPQAFNQVVSYLVWILVLFLLTSKKTMASYYPMLFPFLIHQSMVNGPFSMRRLIPVIILSILATTTFRSRWLQEMIITNHFFTTGSGALLYATVMLKDICLVTILARSWREMKGHRVVPEPEKPKLTMAAEA